jgi:hypothetical protein
MKVTRRYSGKVHINNASKHYYAEYWEANRFPHPIASQAIAALYETTYAKSPSFAFQKNNDFEILGFLGELDESLATFALESWKPALESLFRGNMLKGSAQLNLAWNFGILPLASDISGFGKSMGDLFSGSIGDQLNKGLSKQRHTETGTITNSGPGFDYQSFYTNRFSGTFKTLDLSPQNDLANSLAIFADEIGFHPDLQTVWNLTPFSFLVDYVLPVGHTLDALHPRGWFNPEYTFDGFVTHKSNTTIREHFKPDILGISAFKYFRRRSTGVAVPPKNIALPEFRCPSYRQLGLAASLLAA